ncbi:MAG: serine protease [Elusimicrobiales bacterium]
MRNRIFVALVVALLPAGLMVKRYIAGPAVPCELRDAPISEAFNQLNAGGASEMAPVPEAVPVQDEAPRRIAAIYGEDNRIEVSAANKTIRLLADSSIALILDSDMVFDEHSGGYRLGTENLETKLKLVPGHRFAKQPAAAYCSGAYVGQSGDGRPLVFTAGHCVRENGAMFTCGRDKVVFGYAVRGGGKMPASIPAKEVFDCRVLAHRLDNVADYALLELDRRPAGHEPLAINRGGAIKNNTSVFVIGHPSGLPAKVAGDAVVRQADIEGTRFFSTNLDTFGGNSGSPVFNEKTLLIEGILVSGRKDYDPKPEIQRRSALWYDQSAGSERVTKISEVAAYIEATPIEAYLHERAQEIEEGLRNAPDLGLGKPRVAMPTPAATGEPEDRPV